MYTTNTHRSEFDLAVGILRSEDSETAKEATLQLAQHHAQFQEATMVQVEEYHEVTHVSAQEQQHFAGATRWLQLYYNRLCDERSEKIVSESRSGECNRSAELARNAETLDPGEN